MKKLLLLFPLLFVSALAHAEVLRGIVRNAFTGEVVEGATVTVREAKKTVSTNREGAFMFENLATGRYTIEVWSLGYKAFVLPSYLVSGRHDVVVNPILEEDPQQLGDIEVVQSVNKVESCNPLALMGVRRMTIEETQRIAGSFEDPMRTAASISGVTNQVGDNGISIHGNPPSTVRFHIEGAEIPSPNHFADAMGYGGAFCSSMKTTMLTDWDLFTSAPTAEYGNTVGGVLDYHLRAGNNRKHDFTFKAGVLGLEAMAEGPIGKKGASYLVDYRYALTSLAYDMGLILLNDEMFDFQDFNYKIQIPTQRGGTLSFWGIGQLGDHYWTLTTTGEEAETVDDLQSMVCDQLLMMGGMNLDQPLPHNWRLRATAVASTFKNYNTDSYYPRPFAEKANTLFEDQQQTGQFTASASLQKRLGTRVLLKTGGQYTHFIHDYRFASRKTLFDNDLRVRQDGRNNIGLAHLFAETLIDAGDWHFNLGVASEGITNDTKWSIEPRFSILWQCADNYSFSLGIASSQQMPSLDNLFYYDAQYAGMGDGENLKMILSKQATLGYRWQPKEGVSITAEAYADYLSHLPVGVVDETYCALNRYLFEQQQPLVSQGIGWNFGAAAGIDYYMQNGLYYMLNALVFDNKWEGLDHVWRNTRQNRHWKVSAAVGKEWSFGRKQKNILCINASANMLGGLYDTPVLLEETRANYKNGIPYVVYDKSKAMTRQYDPNFLVNFSATYRINKTRRFSHMIGFEWMNVLMQGEPWTQRYDFKNDRIVDIQTATSLPNLFYQIDF